MKKITLLIATIICSTINLLGQKNRISEYIDSYYTDKQHIENLFEVVEDPTIINKYRNKLKQYKIMKINQSQLQVILKNKSQSLAISVPFPDNTIHELKMVSNGFNNIFFDINTSSNEPVVKVNYINYRGIIDNDKESFCAFTFFEDDLMGVASNKKVGNINIGKIQGEQDLYIIYFAKDLINQPIFNCGVTDTKESSDNLPSYTQKTTLPVTALTNCIRIYLETDYVLYQYLSSSTTNVTAYILGMFNVWAAVYQNEGIKIEISQLYIWTTVDPFTHTSSSSGLNSFDAIRTTFTGDYKMLLAKAGGNNNTGGLAWLAPTCGSTIASNGNTTSSYCGIDGYYNNLPTYSWDITVVSHEFGHNLGSHHTHWCGWPGGAIDGCGPNATPPYNEGCTGPYPPTTGLGTIMSYCNLNVGTNLALGFGPLPNAVILNEYNTRPCLGACVCDAAFTVTRTVTNETCAGLANGAITVTITGGATPYFTKWNTNVTTQSISNIGSGTYTLIVGDANMCPKVITATVQTLYQKPVISLNSPGEVCVGNGTSISASGASTYTWSNGQATPFITVTPSITTSYSCIGTSTDGCVNFAITTISVNPTPTISISSGSVICKGSSAIIIMNGANTYSWSTAETTNSIVVTPSVSATYSCVGYSTKGCFKSASTSVTVNPNPSVTITSNTLCVGNTISISANGATNYTWSTGATTASIAVTPTVTTSYTCIGAYNTGCKNTVVGSVTVYVLPMVSVTSTSVCIGDPAVLNAIGAINYNWSNGTTGPSSITVSPNVNTSYTCIGTSVNGCTNIAVGQVVIYPTPTLALTSGTVCYGMTATVTAAPAASYTWSNGSHASSFFVVPNATTTYTCKGSSSTNCPFISTTTLVVINIATPIITQVGSVLTSSSPSGNQWYLNSIIIPGATGQNYTFTQNGNYSVIISDGNGCSSSPGNKTIFDTGLADIDLKQYMSIFPNPVYDYLQIQMLNNLNEDIHYKIYSDNGQLVKQEVLQNQHNRIVLNDISAGLYLLEISIRSQRAVYKFIKE